MKEIAKKLWVWKRRISEEKEKGETSLMNKGGGKGGEIKGVCAEMDNDQKPAS